MECSEIIQAGSVIVLAIITGYYAIQTHRQANLLKQQIKENREAREKDEKTCSLDRIDEWALGIINNIKNINVTGRDVNISDIRESLIIYIAKIPQIIADTNTFSKDLRDAFRDVHNCLSTYSYERVMQASYLSLDMFTRLRNYSFSYSCHL